MIGLIAEAGTSGTGDARTFTSRSAPATTAASGRTTETRFNPNSRWCDGLEKISLVAKDLLVGRRHGRCRSNGWEAGAQGVQQVDRGLDGVLG